MTDLASRIQEWLAKTGYPLEMQSATKFREAGYEVRQATMFTDPSSGNARDIDVHAFKSNAYGDASVSIVVECKKSDKPWVVLTSPDTLRGYNSLFAFGIMTQALRKSIIDVGFEDPFFQHLRGTPECGYALKQAMSGETDPGYKACEGVMAAARATMLAGTRSTSEAYHLVFPVIAVDSPLFEASLDIVGNIELKLVEQSKLLYGWDSASFSPTCIHVIPMESLAKFAEDTLALANEVISIVERNPHESRDRAK